MFTAAYEARVTKGSTTFRRMRLRREVSEAFSSSGWSDGAPGAGSDEGRPTMLAGFDDPADGGAEGCGCGGEVAADSATAAATSASPALAAPAAADTSGSVRKLLAERDAVWRSHVEDVVANLEAKEADWAALRRALEGELADAKAETTAERDKVAAARLEIEGLRSDVARARMELAAYERMAGDLMGLTGAAREA